MKVYVIYDPLLEKVICVHAEPDAECKVCKRKYEEEPNAYFLEEQEFKVKSGNKLIKT